MSGWARMNPTRSSTQGGIFSLARSANGVSAIAACESGSLSFLMRLSTAHDWLVRGDRELYPEVVDAPEEEGGVPSRLTKTDRREAAKEGTPWMMFAGSLSGRSTRGTRSAWTSSRARALGA